MEGEADKAIAESLRELFSSQHDPINVIVRKDLYECWKRSWTVAATWAMSFPNRAEEFLRRHDAHPYGHRGRAGL